jgi:hypothetical protein
MYANADDVTYAQLDGGVELGVIGVRPAMRHPLRTFYGFLLAKNGVPIGYGDLIVCFEWGELNFHIYDTFRQGESSRIYAGLARTFVHNFGIRYLFLNRYQFGHHNEDAIKSGAFWFYAKLGFRPRRRELVELYEREVASIERNPAHRTSPRDLRRLATDHLGLAIGAESETRWSSFHPMNVALAVSRHAETRHGGDRLAARAEAIARVSRIVKPPREGLAREAFERLAPILALIPNLAAWTKRDREALARVIAAKAAPRERDYLEAAQAHTTLAGAILTLGRK